METGLISKKHLFKTARVKGANHYYVSILSYDENNRTFLCRTATCEIIREYKEDELEMFCL